MLLATSRIKTTSNDIETSETVNQQYLHSRFTPLHYASYSGHTYTVHLLLNHTGINVNIKDSDGNTPLHLAVQNQRYDVVTLLLSQDSVQLDIKGFHERTPFLHAVRQGHLGIINELIARGVEVNAVDSAGENCLFSALGRNAFHSEKEHIALLDKCCTELKRSKDNRLSGVVVACYLARQGADFYHKNSRGNTPLDYITNQALKEKLQTFLQSRFKIIHKVARFMFNLLEVICHVFVARSLETTLADIAIKKIRRILVSEIYKESNTEGEGSPESG
ncbi:E3 ubiquitin-protein ligase MIB2 [Octopus bimaculoides]|uniref:E3 ubiquitin-protein ligase MIB2 n=1 Tax=Octopus bimaculoides TaxID=37653 RepID=UPI0022E4F49C|nr:E3 ubiquitin-protein ligase MIB2 [Octopus bimaculoides]